jgi:hypothetical protein
MENNTDKILSEIINQAKIISEHNKEMNFSQQIEKKEMETEQTKIEAEINSAITNLFEKVKSIANSLNASLNKDKFEIDETVNANLVNRKVKFSFLKNYFYISFFPKNYVSNFNEKRKQEIIQKQKQNFDEDYIRILGKPVDTFIKKENIVVAGLLSSNKQTFYKDNWGYNLILRNIENEKYDWWLFKFYRLPEFSNVDHYNFYGKMDVEALIENFERHFNNGTSINNVETEYRKLQDDDLKAIFKIIVDDNISENNQNNL